MSRQNEKAKEDISEEHAVVVATTAGVPAGHDYGDDAGSGFEGTTAAELSVPFLGILQSNSPQVENEDPEGSKSGMLFNTVTRELTEGAAGQIFLPCHREQAFVEWVPRADGGGFVGLHDPNGEVVKEAIANNDGKRFGKLAVGDNELAETHYMYGLLLEEDGLSSNGFAVISFTSTKIKPYRDWVTAMYTLKGKPPLFANRARIRTVKQTNDHGTFHNFRIDPFGKTWRESLINPKVQGDLLTEAREFRKMVISGMAKAAFETERVAGDPTSGAGGAGSGEDPPF